ncbi:GNAT family protein [Cognatishimia sp. SS12]|uniref:GNAT family N-acetyltransferase n=1 Tax=Cognatishimia sp. SS12 TaxID=2979465 RepID=UPI00232BB787|nr:GNAT family protein [Cognatishimia sp. SS12]MDC0738464.1 GNAT family protein [Cognatishimia sp. SS12]
MWPAPKMLCGEHVTLSPIRHRHTDGLVLASIAKRHMPGGCRVPPAQDMDGEISLALEQQADGKALFFCVQSPDDYILGVTGFDEIDRAHKRLRIGGTWLRQTTELAYSEMMLMLLSFGFDVAGAQTIQMHAPRNASAHRQMLEALGAHLDGVLRGQRLAKDGRAVDMAVYSFVASEWAQSREALVARIF